MGRYVGGDTKAIAAERRENKSVVIEKSRSKPDAGEVLIRTLQVGMGGTNREAIASGHGGFPEDEDHPVLSHEVVGVVVGPNDTELEKGDIIVPTVHRPPASGANEYFEGNQPDMTPDGTYAERDIIGTYDFIPGYFTSLSNYLVRTPRSRAEFGFSVEPVLITEEAREHVYASWSAFDWNLLPALALGNGSLRLPALAMLRTGDKGYEDLYCPGRRDRPDPAIDIIEKLGVTHIDSHETPVEEIPGARKDMDFTYETTGFLRHTTQPIQALAPNGVTTLLDVPNDWEFEVDAGAFHHETTSYNKTFVGGVSSHVKHFEAATATFIKLPRWFLRDLATGVHPLSELKAVFEDDDITIKAAIEFGTV